MINACDKKRTKKRGENEPLIPIEDVEETLVFTDQMADSLKNIDQLLKALEVKQPTYGKIIECRFFAGLTIEETAKVVGTSPSSVKRSWHMARTWLYSKLSA